MIKKEFKLGLLDFFTKKKNDPKKETRPAEEPEMDIYQEAIRSFEENDFLGKAAREKDKAKLAMKEKDYSKAWRHFDEQRMNYIGHAERCGWGARDTMRLIGSVHQNFANIFRLEKRHKDAFVHLVYCLSTDDRPSQGLKNKVKPYFNRLKLKNVTVDDAQK